MTTCFFVEQSPLCVLLRRLVIRKGSLQTELQTAELDEEYVFNILIRNQLAFFFSLSFYIRLHCLPPQERERYQYPSSSATSSSSPFLFPGTLFEGQYCLSKEVEDCNHQLSCCKF